MKSRSKEINIFSMSALDLFASAMGAFILLAVMSMPFFPNTGDSQDWSDEQQEELERAQDELQETQERLGQAEAENENLANELAKVKIPDLDVVICLDVSGSMSEQIEGLKKEIQNLATVLDAIAPSVGISVIAFGDRQWPGEYIFTNPGGIVESTDMAQLRNWVNTRLSSNMGYSNPRNPDYPEALNEALGKAITLNWREVSERHYIMVITDARAYPEEMNQAINRARSFSGDGMGFVSAVYYRNDHPDAISTEGNMPERFLRELSEAGEGNFINSSGGESFLTNLLLAIIN